MPKTFLITQCIQNDFIRPLGPSEPLPNLVHVGHTESNRLAGETGALGPFLAAAHAVDPADLGILHLVDAHQPARHAHHFSLFRPHCIAGSPGAELIPPVGEIAGKRPHTETVTGGDLNDFEDSDLVAALLRLSGGAPADELRVGVIGVWTDMKVSFLFYDLLTRLRVPHLCTCSALTASRSIDAHFRALEHLAGVLGVTVLHSPNSFLSWLLGERAPLMRPSGPRAQVRFTEPLGAPPGWGARELAEREALIGRGDGAEVELSPLAGGYSGSQVYVARRGDADAHILKIGLRDEIAGERFGNERVRRVLGNFVPRLLGYREAEVLAAMEVELAKSGGLVPQTFKSAYQSPDPAMTDLLDAALSDVLDRVLSRFYRTAEKDNGDLLSIYDYVDQDGRPAWAGWIEDRTEAIAREAGYPGRQDFFSQAPLAAPWLDPVAFYGPWMEGRTLRREIYPSIVHGDLNLGNILLAFSPGKKRPIRLWVIDFARLGRLPNLTDFAKLENDLSFILMPIPDEAALLRAARLSVRRVASITLDDPGLESMAETAEERRYAQLIGTLRGIAGELDGRLGAMEDYRVMLLRYAAATLGYGGVTPLQRRLALLCCAQLAGLIDGSMLR